MSAAVQYGASLCDGSGSSAVILLIQEEARLLTVLYVHFVYYTVLCYARDRGDPILSHIPALLLRHAFKGAYRSVTAQVYAVYLLTVFAQHIKKSAKYHITALFYT